MYHIMYVYIMVHVHMCVSYEASPIAPNVHTKGIQMNTYIGP